MGGLPDPNLDFTFSDLPLLYSVAHLIIRRKWERGLWATQAQHFAQGICLHLALTSDPGVVKV